MRSHSSSEYSSAFRVGRKSAALLLACCLAALAACSDSDSSDNSEPIPPRIQFVSGPGYLSFNQEVASGQAARIGVTAQGQGNNSLDSFAVARNGQRVYAETSLSGFNFAYDYTFLAPEAGEYLYTFSIADENGRSDSIQLKLMTVEPSPADPVAQWTGEGFPGGLPSAEIVLPAGDSTTVGVLFEAIDGKRLVRIRAIRQGLETPTDLDFSNDVVNAYLLRQAVVAPDSGSVHYRFRADDEFGRFAEQTLVVTAAP